MKSLILLQAEHYSQAIFWQRTVATGLKHRDSSKVVSVRLSDNKYSCVGAGDALPNGRIEHVDEFIVSYATIIKDLQRMQEEYKGALSIFWNLDIFKAYKELPEEKRQELISLLNCFTSEQHFMYYAFEDYHHLCKTLSQEFWEQIDITQYECPPQYNVIRYVAKEKVLFQENRINIVTDIIEETVNQGRIRSGRDWVIITSEHAYDFALPQRHKGEDYNEWAARADFAFDPQTIGRDFMNIKRKVFMHKLCSVFK